MKRTQKLGLALALVALGPGALAAGACSPPSELMKEDLERPLYSWWTNNSLCSEARAADASGVLWSNGGCEQQGPTPYTKITTLAEAKYSQLKTLFQQFPTAVSCAACSATTCHLFEFYPVGAATPKDTWAVCGGAGGLLDFEGMPEPFHSAVKILQGT